jgi:hypothetical protein
VAVISWVNKPKRWPKHSHMQTKSTLKLDKDNIFQKHTKSTITVYNDHTINNGANTRMHTTIYYMSGAMYILYNWTYIVHFTCGKYIRAQDLNLSDHGTLEPQAFLFRTVEKVTRDSNGGGYDTNRDGLCNIHTELFCHINTISLDVSREPPFELVEQRPKNHMH